MLADMQAKGHTKENSTKVLQISNMVDLYDRVKAQSEYVYPQAPVNKSKLPVKRNVRMLCPNRRETLRLVLPNRQPPLLRRRIPPTRHISQ